MASTGPEHPGPDQPGTFDPRESMHVSYARWIAEWAAEAGARTEAAWDAETERMYHVLNGAEFGDFHPEAIIPGRYQPTPEEEAEPEADL
jgi:hypothetical protein